MGLRTSGSRATSRSPRIARPFAVRVSTLPGLFGSRLGDGLDSIVRNVGWTAVTVALAGFGLALAAVADALARSGADSAGEPLLWIALIIIFVPIFWRLL